MRLFFALWPPREIAERLATIAQLNANDFGGKPTRQETIHLTLAFLGEVNDERLPSLIRAAKDVRATSFDLDIEGLDFWQHNHLIWGRTRPSAALTELAGRLQNTLTEAGFAQGREKQAFIPHLSLVRKVPATSVPLRFPVIETMHWHCASFVLVRSRPSDVPPSYETIYEFPVGSQHARNVESRP